MKKPNIHRLLELQQLLLEFSRVDRIVHRKHGADYRAENDTEHSYNLAITAMYLAPYFPELDAERLVLLGLIHDFVEVYAGDTYVFADPSEIATKAIREKAAQEKLAKQWPDFPRLHELIEEYETKSSKEAIFTYALDKIMPVMTIFINEGYTWEKEKLTLDRLKWHKDTKVSLSPEVTEYYNQLIDILASSPYLKGGQTRPSQDK